MKFHWFLPVFLLQTILAFGQRPVANFSAPQVSGCSPFIVTFQDLSTNNPTSWSWTFSNGSTSTLQNPTVAFFSPGSYTVTLTASNGNGSDLLSRTAFITVYDKPMVDFTADTKTGCYPLPVQFQDSSKTTPGATLTKYEWDFGNGLQSTETAPRITYTMAGNFTVSLKVTNDKGCFATLSRAAYIKIDNGLKLSFDNTAADRCRAPFPITFTNKSTGPGALTYAWDFGDGQTMTGPAVTHDYATPGTYTVALAVSSSSGCTDTLRKENIVSLPDIQSSFDSPDSLCVSTRANFTNTSTPAPQSSRWDFGDGTDTTGSSATKTFTAAGTYTVRLYNTYTGCTDTFAKNVVAVARPQSDFSADTTLFCRPPATATFVDRSVDAVAWAWDFGDGQTSTEQNPVHTYADNGDYTVVLVTTNRFGCTDRLRRRGFIKIHKPDIVFPRAQKAGCIPFTTTLSATVATLDSITGYLWDLGDGTTSTEQKPTHTYANQGSYNVSLTVTTSTGCTETALMPKPVLAGRRPVVRFTAQPNPVCGLQNVFFTGITNEGDTWLWSFGDGDSATVQNPSHAYADTGRYTVTMTVINSGCRAASRRNNLIRVKPPIAKFQERLNCRNTNQFSFTDESIGAQSWFWDFGDSTTSNSPNPTHDYVRDGTYTVTLTVTNDTCSNSISKKVFVFNHAVTFTADQREACKPATIQYTSTVFDSTLIAAYNWNFGNGNTDSIANPQAAYTTSGNFTTTFVATDIYGCKDTSTQANFIRINGPLANFTAVNNKGCKGLTATFIDTSTTDGVHEITSWEWQYGDGSFERFTSRSSVQHTYTDTGNYNVQLLVTDAAGCTDSLRYGNFVTTTAPRARFSSADTLICLGSTAQFNNGSTGYGLLSNYSFGDNTGSTLDSPAHLYADTGSYTVSLKVVDSVGCSDSVALLNLITVKKTTASFDVSDSIGSCTPFEVRFTNTSAFFTASRWLYDNTVNTATNPVKTFTVGGNYAVKLFVTGRGGCVDSAEKTIRIYDDNNIKFSYSPVAGCAPVMLKTSVSTPMPMTYTWDFGDGTLVTTTSPDTTHLYTGLGSYLPRLIVSGSGCLVPVTGVDTVRVTGIVTRFGSDKQLLCDSGTVQFIDSTQSNDPVAYKWSFGDGKFSTEQNPAHSYTLPGTYTVSLFAQTASLCRDTTTFTNLIKVVQSPQIAIIGDTVVCQGAPLTNTGRSLRPDTASLQWSWDFPNGARATTMQPPVQRYTTAGDFVIKAVAINSSGCSDTATRSLHVNALPTAILPDSITTAAGLPVIIQPALYSPGILSYAWSPAATLSCANCPQPTADPKVNTLYTVTVADSNNCQASASVLVKVSCLRSNVFVPNTFSPNGDGSNDVFYVRGQGLARVKSLRVFNRFGEVVFERQNFMANDASAGWDGTYKGSKLTPDTFIYQVDVFCENSDTIRFDGSITLIR